MANTIDVTCENCKNKFSVDVKRLKTNPVVTCAKCKSTMKFQKAFIDKLNLLANPGKISPGKFRL